jgi:hypothetical protein
MALKQRLIKKAEFLIMTGAANTTLLEVRVNIGFCYLSEKHFCNEIMSYQESLRNENARAGKIKPSSSKLL